MSAMTKKEWMAYIEKTWDAAQKEAWSEPQFECPRCGHCCQTKLETEQEPVAWLSEGGDVSRSKRYMDEMGFKCNPLYTAPPRKQWVGLTDDEVNELVSRFKRYSYVLLREVEAKLKEKNT